MGLGGLSVLSCLQARSRQLEGLQEAASSPHPAPMHISLPPPHACPQLGAGDAVGAQSTAKTAVATVFVTQCAIGLTGGALPPVSP